MVSVRQALGLLAAVAGAILLIYLFGVILLIFSAILFAIFIDSIARVFQRLGMPRSLGLIATWLALIGVLSAMIAFFAAPIAEQAEELSERIPEAIDEILPFLERIGIDIDQLIEQARTILTQPALFEQTLNIFATALGIIVSIVIVLLIGTYLAIEPATYRNGFVMLFPQTQIKISGILDEIGRTLRMWIFSQMLSMTTVALITGFGLWLLGVPLAFLLGIIAGILNFVPNIGPVIAAIPAVLIALLQSPMLGLLVIILFVAVQTLESTLITPLIHRGTLKLPPALTITAQISGGFFAGFLGLLLAVPLLLVIMILVRRVHIDDAFGYRKG